MKERGRVVEVFGNIAKVEIYRKEECNRCKVCGFGSREKIVAITENSIGAKEHDEVELELEGARVVRAAVILYLVPIIFLLLGLVLGSHFASFINRKDLVHLLSLIWGFGLLAFSYIGIAFYSKHPSILRYRAKIIRILDK